MHVEVRQRAYNEEALRAWKKKVKKENIAPDDELPLEEPTNLVATFL